MHEIENELLKAIRSFASQMPQEQLDDIASLVLAGEPGIAIENLCTQLYEYNVTIDRESLQRLRCVGDAMGIASKYFDRL